MAIITEISDSFSQSGVKRALFTIPNVNTTGAAIHIAMLTAKITFIAVSSLDPLHAIQSPPYAAINTPATTSLK